VEIMLSLINLPTPSEFFSSVGQWSSAFFDELKPILYYVVGITLAVLFGFLLLRAVGWLWEKFRGE